MSWASIGSQVVPRWARELLILQGESRRCCRHLRLTKGGFVVDVLVFDHLHALDLFEIRSNLVRIPEVIRRLRDAQEEVDRLDLPGLDLVNFVSSEDAIFLRNIRHKTLASALVQLGLFDRYRRLNSVPHFIFGVANGVSPLAVASGQKSFSDFIIHALGRIPQNNLGQVRLELPLLAGVELPSYQAFQRTGEGFLPMGGAEADGARALLGLVANQGARRVVAMGAADSPLHRLVREQKLNHVELTTAVSLDPVLSWFWRELSAKPQIAVQ